MSENMPELPRGWCWTTLGDIAVSVRNGVSTAPREQSGVPILRISSIRPMQIDTREIRYLPGSLVEYDDYRLEPEDLLFTRYNGNPALVGACAVVPQGFHGVYPDKLIRVTVSGLSPRYVCAAASVGVAREHIRIRTRSTAGQAGISGANLKKTPLPVAPLPEQRRIVETIESYFTRLDAAVAALERVQANLKRYRAAVLKAAVEGRLVPTEAELARQEGRDYEPADVLLERILQERRRRWEEAELAKMKAKGKLPKNDQWKAKYKEPAPPDTSNLPELPEGWCWVSVDQMFFLRNGINFSASQKGSVGTLTVDVLNMYSSGIHVNLDSLYRVDKQGIQDHFLKNGDLLFVRSSVKREGVGWCSVFQEVDEPVVFCGFLIRGRPVTECLRPEYFGYFMRSSSARREIIQGANQVTITNISQDTLRGLCVPLPPFGEQLRIVTEIESLLSKNDAAQRLLDAGTKRCQRLRQSILKWAFEGKLVDQDPTDEPAKELLERIKAERQASETTKKTTKPRGRRKKTTS